MAQNGRGLGPTSMVVWLVESSGDLSGVIRGTGEGWNLSFGRFPSPLNGSSWFSIACPPQTGVQEGEYLNRRDHFKYGAFCRGYSASWPNCWLAQSG
jgi:hypothetical protein